jgi:hypothetical protein
MKTKRTKTIMMIMLIIVVIIIQGCTNNRPTVINFYQGIEGIELNFLNNAPPRTITGGDEISIFIEVANKGAHTTAEKDTIISLRYNSFYFQKDITDLSYSLSTNPVLELNRISGKSDPWPRGEFFVLPLAKLKAQEVPGTIEMPTTEIDVNVCYSYKTYFSEMICLDTDIFEMERQPICRNRGTFTYTGQGAPIAVNKLEVDIRPVGFQEVGGSGYTLIQGEDGEVGLAEVPNVDRLIMIEPVIRIYAKNVGGGSVFIMNNDIHTKDACSHDTNTLRDRENNKVKITKVMLDGQPMDCGEKTTLNLANPSEFISCKLNPEQTGYLRQNLEVPLSIELDYFYTKTETAQITIQRAR